MKHIRKFNESESKDEENIIECFATVFDLAVSYKIFESRVEELETENDYDCYDVDIKHEYYGHGISDISETDFNKYVDILNEIRESVEKLKEIYNYKIQFAETNTSKITVKIYK